MIISNLIKFVLLLFLCGCGIKGRPLPPTNSTPVSQDQSGATTK